MNVLVNLPGCVVERVRLGDGRLVLEAHKRNKYERCPDCGRRSGSVHSSYNRHPDDLPLCEHRLELCLSVRRFRCLNPRCKRCTFAEPFPDLVLRYAQRTCRLRTAQGSVGLAVGGEGGSALLEMLHMHTSPDTLLRIIRSMPLPELDTTKVLGVDDWSFRKGRKFGTILVDLERQRVVDLLPDRSAETLIAWLKEHPEVEVVSRDRSTDYQRAAKEGAPQAVQVADRWHLLKNLGESLKHWLERQRVALNKAAKTLLPPPVKVARNERTEANQKLYEQIIELREQKFTFRRIAEKVGVSPARVGRWLKQGSHTIHPKVQSKITPYLPYAQQRYDEGITSVFQIYKEILEQGYDGTYAPLYSYFKAVKSGWGDSWPTRPEHPQHPQQPAMSADEVPSTSTDTATTLTPPAKPLDLYGRIFALSTKPKEMNTDQATWFTAVAEHLPEAKKLNRLAVKFQALVRKSLKQSLEQLKSWLEQCANSGIKEMERFANGIQQDLEAVQAAITLPWSNGQVEGQVNKLKLIKRMMYGRANFDLLRKRVLLASLHGTCE